MRPGGPVLNIFPPRLARRRPKGQLKPVSRLGAAMCCRAATGPGRRASGRSSFGAIGYPCGKSGYEWDAGTRGSGPAVRTSPRTRSRRNQGGAAGAGWGAPPRRGADQGLQRAQRRPLSSTDRYLGRSPFGVPLHARRQCMGRGVHRRPVTTQVSMFPGNNLRGAAGRRPDPRSPTSRGSEPMAGTAGRQGGPWWSAAGQDAGETIGNGRAMAILFAREGAPPCSAVDRVAERAEEDVRPMIAEAGRRGRSSWRRISSRPPIACALG